MVAMVALRLGLGGAEGTACCGSDREDCVVAGGKHLAGVCGGGALQGHVCVTIA